jgi:putrescine aminotransferase
VTLVVPEQVADRHRDHVSKGRAQLGRLMGGHVEVASSGAVVRDSAGERFLSCGGYGVFLLGHSHPRVVAAVVEQVRTHPLATRMLLEARIAEAAEAVAHAAPEGLDYVHFVTTGAEAAETALKLGRAHGRRRIVATEGAYHGKTLGALSVTGRDFYRDPFRPLLPDVEHVPFGDAAALEAAIADHPGGCCVILEPIQAEGGVVIPPPGYLRAVEAACRRHGAFLVIDEIQTGLGRTGTWWCCSSQGVTPDVLLIGKTLSGGVVPVAAAVATAAAYEPMSADPYLHTSTYSGAPLGCAAAIATLRTIEAERIVPRARRLGETILDHVQAALHDTIPELVSDVRGCGLLIGMEFEDAGVAGEFALEMLRQRVIVSHSLNASRVVRLTPPALLSDAELEWLVDAVTASARSLAREFTMVAT